MIDHRKIPWTGDAGKFNLIASDNTTADKYTHAFEILI